MSILVKQPGILSSLQDQGRYGAHNIGLTTGGALDQQAFAWANKLLNNTNNACAIELSFGGMVLEAQVNTYIAVTGATAALTINDSTQDMWRSHQVKKGDKISIGIASQGTRIYIAVKGGFQTPVSFGSRSTVIRENIGGLDGQKLTDNDVLQCDEINAAKTYHLPLHLRPVYDSTVTLRVVVGYQESLFTAATKARFFASTYTLTDRADRMGMRLEGSNVACDTTQMLSEGICLGAIQIPADGQPIVLLNDRQTIGGYPKIGSVCSHDIGKLAQLRTGDSVRFCAIDLHEAHNINALAAAKLNSTQLEPTGE